VLGGAAVKDRLDSFEAARDRLEAEIAEDEPKRSFSCIRARRFGELVELRHIALAKDSNTETVAEPPQARQADPGAHAAGTRLKGDQSPRVRSPVGSESRLVQQHQSDPAFGPNVGFAQRIGLAATSPSERPN
jgi:hypothetical protein